MQHAARLIVQQGVDVSKLQVSMKLKFLFSLAEWRLVTDSPRFLVSFVFDVTRLEEWDTTLTRLSLSKYRFLI